MIQYRNFIYMYCILSKIWIWKYYFRKNKGLPSLYPSPLPNPFLYLNSHKTKAYLIWGTHLAIILQKCFIPVTQAGVLRGWNFHPGFQDLITGSAQILKWKLQKFYKEKGDKARFWKQRQPCWMSSYEEALTLLLRWPLLFPRQPS